VCAFADKKHGQKKQKTKNKKVGERLEKKQNRQPKQ
jgi:hypothetical protein